MAAEPSLWKSALLEFLAQFATLGLMLALAGWGVQHMVTTARPKVTKQISQHIDGHMSAHSMSLGWAAKGPTLTLDKVRLFRPGKSQPGVRIQRLAVGFDLGRLFHGQFKPRRITIGRPRITVGWRSGGHLRLLHWSRPQQKRLTWKQINRMRNGIHTLIIKNAQVKLDGGKFPNGGFTLSSLNVTLNLHKHRHSRASFSLNGPWWLPAARGHIKFRGNVPELDHAKFFVHARATGPLALASVLSTGSTPKASAELEQHSAGRLDVTIRGRWLHDHLVHTRARFKTRAAVAASDAKTKPVHLKAGFHIHQKPGSQHLSVHLAHVSGNVAELKKLQLDGRVRINQQTLTLKGKHLPGALIARVAKHRIKALRGADLHLAVPSFRASAGVAQPLKLSAEFDQLQYADSHLSFGPISGHYEQTGDFHAVHFHGAGGTIQSKRYLNGALPVHNLGGTLAWRGPSKNMKLQLKNLSASSGDNHLSVNGSVQKAAGQAPVADITAQGALPHITEILKHIPTGTGLPNPKLRHWLVHQIAAGGVPSATLKLNGPLSDFPFAGKNPAGNFNLKLTARNVTLRPKPGWPRLEHANGTLRIHNVKLNAKLSQGSIAGVTLGPSSGSIADLRKPVFAIDAHTRQTSLQKLRTFILDSPLRQQIGNVVRPLHVSGPAEVQANLTVPLKPDLPKLQVHGHLHLRDDTLKQAALPLPMTHIKGQLAFARGSVTGHDIKAQLADAPLTADLTPASGGGEHIRVHGHTKLPRDKRLLAHYIPPAWLDYLQGRTQFNLAFCIGPHGHRSPFHIHSNLKGMAINLPTPLSKQATASTPVSVHVAADGSNIQARYNHRLKLGLRLKNGTRTQVHALIGHNPPPPPPGPGIWVGGNTPAVNGLGWFQVVHHILAARAKASAGKGQSKMLAFRGAQLTIGELRLGGIAIPNLNFSAHATRAHNLGWAINLSGPNADGHLTINNAQKRLHVGASIHKLALTHDKTEGHHKASSNSTSGLEQWPVLLPNVVPTDLPAISATIAQLSLDKQKLGTVRINANTTPDGWRLNSAKWTAQKITAHASGDWQRANGRTKAQLSLHLDGQNLATIAQSLGLSVPLKAQTTHLQADLKVAPNPRGLDLSALGGTTHVELDNGNLPQVNPGPARILGLLNINKLPSRLQLNFNDISKPGLAFGKLVVPGKILNGNAFIRNAEMTTPSAEIAFNGRVGLASRDINARVVITPQVGSGLTIASTVFGGPLAGAAIFGLQELLQQPINQLSRLTFNIRGGWNTLAIIDQKTKSPQ